MRVPTSLETCAIETFMVSTKAINTTQDVLANERGEEASECF